MAAFIDTGTVTHIVVIGAMAALTLLLGLIIWRARRTVMNRELRKLPRASMPMHREDMSRAQHQVILAELLRRQDTKVEPLPHLSGQVGWGKTGTVYENIHFKTYPQLKRPESQSVKAYLGELEQRCSALDRDIVQQYVLSYEKARFGPQEVTLQEYQTFMNTLLKLVQCLDTSPIDVSDLDDS